MVRSRIQNPEATTALSYPPHHHPSSLFPPRRILFYFILFYFISSPPPLTAEADGLINSLLILPEFFLILFIILFFYFYLNYLFSSQFIFYSDHPSGRRSQFFMSMQYYIFNLTLNLEQHILLLLVYE